MADERDPKVSQRYREMGAEEPPRALDDAILAASRRAVESQPAPLVVPTGRRRWYFPVAAAAVITLAVAVTLQIERQKPDDELVASAPAQKQPEPARELLKEQQTPEPAAKAAPKPAQPQPSPRGFTPEPPPVTTTDSMARRDAPQSAEKARQEAAVGELRNKQAEVQTAPAERKAEAAAAPQAAPAAPAAAGARSAPAPDARTGVLASRVERTPERWLDEIAELRKQGKHDEADKALADFRKRYPDYRMSDDVKAKVEKK